MEKNKPKGYFSEEFKDLVTKMIDLKDRRATMDDIINHPWFTNNDIPSLAEIRAEFTERDRLAKQALEQERQERKLYQRN